MFELIDLIYAGIAGFFVLLAIIVNINLRKKKDE